MERQNFINWLKAVGMFFIVTGHIVGSPTSGYNLVTQPIFTKQLGVCFFIFIIGWGLAHEQKKTFKVVFNRIFPMYFYGILFSLLLSSIFFLTKNDINQSNYLPYMLGINVFFNYFPANPTTWYIGTYLHILLFWFVFLRGVQITKQHLVIALIAEITIRAFILSIDKDFIAYMFLHNWITVFLLGGYLFQKQDTKWQPKTVGLVLLWLIIVALWASPLNTIISPGTFPFSELKTQSSYAPILRSCIISILYIINTYVFFEIFRRLPKSAIVEFFARNSLITFIIHMPLVYAFHKNVYSYFDAEWSQKLSFIIIIFVSTAIISEIIEKTVKVEYFQAKAWDLYSNIMSKVINKKHS